jgi:hypothetical protein
MQLIIETSTSTDAELEAASRLLLSLVAITDYAPQPTPIPETTAPTVADIPLNVDTGITIDPDTPPPAPEIPAPAVGDLDQAGVAWDASIHSSGKTQNKNGTWKLKKGADKALVEQVIASQQGAAPVLVPVDTTDPTAALAAANAAFANAGEAQPPEPAPVPAAGEVVVTWPDLLAIASAAQIAGTLNQAALDAYLTANGVADFTLAAGRPDLFAGMIAAIGQPA